MTPLIDVVFLLLLFFMLASTFARFASIDLTLAREGGGTDAVAGMPTIFLAVREDARFAINGQAVAAGEIGARLNALRADGGARVVVRSADGAVAQDVITAVDAARRADVGPVLLVH